MAFWNQENDKITVEKTVKEIALSSYNYSNKIKEYNFDSYIRRFDDEEILSDVLRRFANLDMDFSIHMDFITNMYEAICINKDKLEERTTFKRLLDLYVANPEIFINNNNFNKIASAFYDKQMVLEYFRFVLGHENTSKGIKVENLSEVMSYVCTARQYYVDDRALLTSAFYLINNFDPVILQIGDLNEVKRQIEAKLREDKKACGIYDFDQNTIAELDAKIDELDGHGLQLSSLISSAQEQLKAIKSSISDGTAEISRAKLKALKELETKLNSLAQNFDRAYDTLLNQKRESLNGEEDAILTKINDVTTTCKQELKDLVGSLSSVATLELNRIRESGNAAVAKVNGIVDDNEELQKILSKHQDSNSLINVLEQLGNLGPENLSRLLGVSASTNGTVPTGVIPTGSSVVVAPEIIMHKPEEPVDLTVNYYFDQTIPFKQRFDQVMELKRKDIAENGTVYHERFDEAVVYFLLGQVPYLCGESGVGKSRLAQQMCDLLNLKMHINGFIEFPQDLLGYTNAADGAYVPSNFYRCYKYGYTIFLDELDNGQPKGTVTLGRFIDPDNKEYMFPDGKITRRHPNFRIITSGNTKGSGRTQKYNARDKIDEAIMARLKVVEMFYDNKIGKAILKDYQDWYNFGINFAEAVSKCGNIGGSFSAREANSLKTDLDTGCLSTEAIMEATFIKTKDSDLLQRIITKMQEQLGNGSFTQGGKKLLTTFTNVVNSRGNQLCKRR